MENQADKAYGYLFKLRENANSLLLSRTSIMIVIQAAVISFIANTFSSLINEYSGIILIVELFGLASSIFMAYLIRSGIFWLSYWDNELKEVEADALGKFKIFRTHPYLNQDKKMMLGNFKSTRTALLFFAVAFVIVWFILIAYTLTAI